MSPNFNTVIQAGDDERRGLFLTTATRLGTAIQHVEKDFWVCWALDALFNGLPPSGPRLLFKGGTSLSKSFGLISRFSEDIDITVFREDIGEPAEAADLNALSGKQRRIRLERIRAACQRYIAEDMAVQLREIAVRVMPADRFRLELDPDDPDQQTLLFWYPAVTAAPGDYVRSAVKIEAGAKSALDPHEAATVIPYVADDLPDLDMAVHNVMTVKPERTFWDKIIILHGLRQWHDRRGQLRQGGQRVSRHYYDIYRLLQYPDAAVWQADHSLARDCAQHARLFFGSADLGLDTAAHGTFTLVPPPPMRETLARDYAAMGGMIFGSLPEIDDVLHALEVLEIRLNVSEAQVR
ncbi:nucleotidyl transferase AbiEii/AbiGii toxin family protein [Achromobacter xylosoxidans]|uniref:nucleotidyl transferase AbiEii/AbiGii toxin family protein n=1 Tax=Alcaligenes xylosoxydans xylosoxydans TaxID=85698 RepID=UPI0022B8AEAB|nr:nucleotidyl transferase AbiEii/AbiGii toxin family protein [Achromobacter xylosoxidans]MCZ8391584.1 nucleotidyl transferase AbiEii/AbiGii toxin family protein [Achromobacter xylosoxidans]